MAARREGGTLTLVVGLGNPGARYAGTRHNVGFLVVDELARRHDVAFEAAPASALMARVRGLDGGLILAKPLTFMNLSGGAVGDLARYFRIEIADLLVVTDDVNLPLGRLRARARGSAGGHNGLESIVALLGPEFPRLRLGVGRGDARRDLADHVLARFEPDERQVMDEAIGRAADACECFVREGIDATMNRFNRDPQAPDDPGQAREE
jgi:PTH1 family peptidyl-tRNA hydrolase